ncbi:MAG: ATP synthase F1 subunit delta [Chlorobi bacterium]|nr:ATP synthase F1 subunit delta [Chlorobiota bacterium]
MNTNRVTVRYAKALYAFAEEHNKTEVVNNDMRLISQLVNIPEFRNMLENPVIFPSKKIETFNKIVKNKVDDITKTFFKLLAENKREVYLGAAARNYGAIFRKKNNIKAAEFITAFNPDKNLYEKVSKILEEQYNSKIDLTVKTDKSIIGGFVLTVDGMQYDASVAEKLKNVKKDMLNA